MENCSAALAMPLPWRARLASLLVVAFELQRRMMHMKSLAELRLDFELDRGPTCKIRIFYDDVRLKCALVLIQFPKMQMVNVRHPVHSLHRRDQLFDGDIIRSAFHENMDRSLHIGNALP